MPTRPKEQKRSADMIGSAIKGTRLSASEQREEQGADDGKDAAAKSLGSRGGKARAKVLDSKRRSEIAKLGAAARWKRD